MSEKDDYINNLRRSTGMRLSVLFFAFFILLLVASGFASFLTAVPGTERRTAVLLSSMAQCIIAFCIPAWLTARFSSCRPMFFLGISESIEVRPFIGIVIVYILALPAMNQLIIWNENISFPEWASGMEATLRSWEKTNGDVAAVALSASGFMEMIAGVAVIGILTGFSEELFFRGAMQNIFRDSGVGRGTAVWITAIIFSAVHFQFFGFFPRLLMGVFFGYLIMWTGSLWPSVFAHALNNSIVVVSTWICGDSSSGMIENFGTTTDGAFPWVAVFSLVATVIFFIQLRDFFFTSFISRHHG